jgi:hypothetical protein
MKNGTTRLAAAGTWSAVPFKAIAKTLTVQNRFHPNQALPTRLNKFVFNWQGRAGRYFYGYQLPYAVSNTRRLRDL